jgi:hypothetical protein
LELAGLRGNKEFQLSRSRLPAAIRYECLQHFGICKEVGYAIIEVGIRNLPMHFHKRQAAHQMNCCYKIKGAF